MQGENCPFTGFEEPEQNWSKLPHQFIDALPMIDTKGELQVILYVLRHTWGFQDHQKKITLDEFVNGRKRRDRSRMDDGCGASKPAVIKGIRLAVQHGFLSVEKRGDAARAKHFYSLRMESRNVTPEVTERDPGGQETLPRSEKETLDTNLEKEGADAPPAATSKHPAIQMFKTKTKRFPVTALYQEIADTVGEEPDNVQFWGQVVYGWLSCGWAQTNYGGMLDRYRDRSIPTTGGSDNGSNQTGATGQPDDDARYDGKYAAMFDDST